MTRVPAGERQAGKASAPTVRRVDVVVNNIPGRPGFASGWGNSFLMRGPGVSLLFDTGCDGSLLLYNLRKLGVGPEDIDTVVISHDHWDHTGGLKAFLWRNRAPKIFLPARFSEKTKRDLRAAGARLEYVRGPRPVVDGVYSTGQMAGRKWEQGLIVDAARGPALFTGCAHPGIVKMARRCSKLRGTPYLVAGGFHLKDSSRGEIKTAVRELRAMGIKKAAPDHCTGAAAIKLFRAAWKKDLMDAACGARIILPAPPRVPKNVKKPLAVTGFKASRRRT